MQFLAEEYVATALDLHEAHLQTAAAGQGGAGESDVRARHRRLVEQLQAEQAG